MSVVGHISFFLCFDFDYGLYLIDIVFSFGYFMFYTMHFYMPFGCTGHVSCFCIAVGNVKLSFVVTFYFSCILHLFLVFFFYFRLSVLPISLGVCYEPYLPIQVFFIP